MSPELSTYITQARSAGMTDGAIRVALEAVGWQAEHVLAALAPDAPSPAATPIIQVRNLIKRYGAFTAVNGVSFEVLKGETFGILGPNGAGKTTTLEIIEGLKRPSAGTILVDGNDVTTQTHAVKSVIGVQLQASTFFELLTLKELLTVFASLYGRTIDPMELLAEVQLTEKANSQVKELSGGQKQRFSIAVGLVNAPKVLFLDEPTTGLDPQARRNLWELVRSIKAKGTTIVLTTHYMDEAQVLCDRIAIMDAARIVALDTTKNLLNSLGVDSTIEFRSTAAIANDVLANISGVLSAAHENGQHTLTVSDAQAAMDGLFAASRRHQFPIDAITLKRPTLEDVFLKFTGHQLRD